MSKLSHIDEKGNARMVDVSAKIDTEREALARGCVVMKPETLKLIMDGAIPKGDVFGVSRIAGIMAAKRTSELIPMCHPIPITGVTVELKADPENNAVLIEARVRTVGKTGVEMEALTSVSAAALALYDMCKAIDRDMIISDVRLVRKTGGKSGDFEREGEYS